MISGSSTRCSRSRGTCGAIRIRNAVRVLTVGTDCAIHVSRGTRNSTAVAWLAYFAISGGVVISGGATRRGRSRNAGGTPRLSGESGEESVIANSAVSSSDAISVLACRAHQAIIVRSTSVTVARCAHIAIGRSIVSSGSTTKHGGSRSACSAISIRSAVRVLTGVADCAIVVSRGTRNKPAAAW